MAGIDLSKVNRDHAKMTALAIKAGKSKGSSNPLVSVWHWINGVASGEAHVIKAIADETTVTADYIKFLTGTVHFVLTSLQRALNWLEHDVIDPLEQRVNGRVTRLAAKERADVRYLIRLIYVSVRAAMAYASKLTVTEHRRMMREFRRAEAAAKLDVRRLHHRIEHEAASGYTIDRRDRTGLIVHLLEFAGVHNPVIAPVVADIAAGLLDLLAVDDPIARVTIGFLIKHVIDRMGIEKPLGHLINDLLTPILGSPQPRDLHDIMASISARLDALEGQWATFFTDGGSQVEQAGKEWQGITSIAASVGIVAFTAQAVADPAAWATEIQTVIGRPANDLVSAAADLFRG